MVQEQTLVVRRIELVHVQKSYCHCPGKAGKVLVGCRQGSNPGATKSPLGHMHQVTCKSEHNSQHGCPRHLGPEATLVECCYDTYTEDRVNLCPCV